MLLVSRYVGTTFDIRHNSYPSMIAAVKKMAHHYSVNLSAANKHSPQYRACHNSWTFPAHIVVLPDNSLTKHFHLIIVGKCQWKCQTCFWPLSVLISCLVGTTSRNNFQLTRPAPLWRQALRS